MRCKILQKLSRYRIKAVTLLFLVGFLTYSVYISVANYDVNAINDETLSSDKLATSHLHEITKEGKTSATKYDSDSILHNKEQRIQRQHEFWDKIFTLYDENGMNFKDSPSNLIELVEKSDESRTKKALLSRAKMSDETVLELKKRHARVMEKLPDEMPDFTYKKDTTGIVFIGGEKFSWLTYLAILALRETGTKLPVEVIMPRKKDYEQEKQFCDSMLRELDAQCVMVPDMFGDSVMKKRSFHSYQFKSIALAISSFQHILLLDSDNMIVSIPDLVFQSSLYKESGMITWPDYWKRTIYPKYYEIAGIKVNERKRRRYNRFPLFAPKNSESDLEVKEGDESVPYHDLENAVPDLSTESGQLMINKGTHGKTILLSLYYNVYGPDIFYKLFSLGEQGEGDKDTFVAAAVATDQNYYQVKSFIMSPGYFDDAKVFKGVAMAQKNPLADYERFQELIIRPFEKSGKTMPVSEQIKQLEQYANDGNEKFGSHNGLPVFTIHCNYPKLDPINYMSKEDLYDPVENKLKYRLYDRMKYSKTIMNKSTIENVEVDFEYEQWLHIREALCVKKLEFEFFKNQDMERLCNFISNQVDWLAPDELV
ncbi:hypothetical protein KGF56_004459 [Candida oxycetoniae]|uniref:Uncharacterized protein n=1 Tax=Candida oxycetoniae TaxID=497107 RepID=A0AAI9WW30_9ASCO|nr:uncharacterized protein KGF56_004459 [Candida oxycetoniae]KAI3402785.2 hypothetical protein KGF56_004459 [Candida oxycetoniae]